MTITAHNFEIATPPGALVNVMDLATPLPSPKPDWKDFTQAIDTADGGVKGGGWEVATWKWTILKLAQRAQLKTFCPNGLSAPILIRTWTSSGAFVYREGVMVWPVDEGEHSAGRVLDFEIRFQDLIPYTPP